MVQGNAQASASETGPTLKARPVGESANTEWGLGGVNPQRGVWGESPLAPQGNKGLC